MNGPFAAFAAGLRQTAREIVLGGRGIALLTFGQPAGIRAFSNDIAATRRSFVTAILSLPIFVMFHLLSWLAGVGPLEPPHAMILDLLSFPISWAGFALLSIPLVRMLGVEQQWPRYIAAWNWSNLGQYALLFVTSLPVVLHAPSIAGETSALVGYGWALWLEWYVTRLVLNVSPAAAALLVAVDVGFSAIVSLVTLIPLQSLSLG
jgi:hypothetical protein